MNTNVDLHELTVKREGPAKSSAPHHRNILTRYVLPGVILLGFGAVLVWAARDSLLPSKSVTVVPVLATRAEVQQGGTPLFQSAGWVEPRPTPVIVSALAEGVVEQLLVVEGQEVKAGQVVARLIDADAKITLAGAAADLEMRKAELVVSRAVSRSADAKAELAKFVLTSRAAAYDAKGIPEIEFRQAESELKTATAAKEEAEANVKVAEARIQQAKVGVEVAQLRLDRMTVKAAASGRVLALVS